MTTFESDCDITNNLILNVIRLIRIRLSFLNLFSQFNLRYILWYRLLRMYMFGNDGMGKVEELDGDSMDMLKETYKVYDGKCILLRMWWNSYMLILTFCICGNSFYLNLLNLVELFSSYHCMIFLLRRLQALFRKKNRLFGIRLTCIHSFRRYEKPYSDIRKSTPVYKIRNIPDYGF